jgi:hypothetical protein
VLVQVCPPGRGGVRDFADRLHDAWAARGIASGLVEGRRAQPGETALAARLDALASAFDGRLSVVLHFSGYGYANRGLCQWLVDELQALKSRRGGRVRLVVVFHELFAGDAMPWRSAFWLAPWQSRAARRLARLADALWTNTQRHADWLEAAVDAATPLQVRPVFSNVGEAAAPARWQARAPQAVVFGTAATRRRALAALPAHAGTLARLGVRELVEVGDGGSQRAGTIGVPLRYAGRLSAHELGGVLTGARFGLLDYPAPYLAKSGVFAAYAAHGCAVIDSAAPAADTDGLRAGLHYVALASPLDADADAMARMASRLHLWYRGHPLALQAGEVLDVAQGLHATRVEATARRLRPETQSARMAARSAPARREPR